MASPWIDLLRVMVEMVEDVFYISSMLLFVWLVQLIRVCWMDRTLLLWVSQRLFAESWTVSL